MQNVIGNANITSTKYAIDIKKNFFLFFILISIKIIYKIITINTASITARHSVIIINEVHKNIPKTKYLAAFIDDSLLNLISISIRKAQKAGRRNNACKFGLLNKPEYLPP
jgi:hypothetical protein